MTVVITVGIVIALVVLLGALAAIFGTDTRDGQDPRGASGRSI